MKNEDSGLSIYKSESRKVKSAWIDSNNHMNVAYYTLAFDEAIDEFLDSELQIGPSSSLKTVNQGSYALQSQYRYLTELLEDDKFYITIFVADFTEKKMHLMLQMYESSANRLCASCETIMINVDLEQRRSCNYSISTYEKLSELHQRAEQLRSSIVMGHPIGLRK